MLFSTGIDNETCTFGSVVSFKKGSKPRHLDLRLNLRVLLVDSRVSRETHALVVKVAGLRQRNMAAVDHIMDALDDVAHTATQVSRTRAHCHASQSHPRIHCS